MIRNYFLFTLIVWSSFVDATERACTSGLELDFSVVQRTLSVLRDASQDPIVSPIPRLSPEDGRLIVAFGPGLAHTFSTEEFSNETVRSGVCQVNTQIKRIVDDSFRDWSGQIQRTSGTQERELVLTGKGWGGAVAELVAKRLVENWGTIFPDHSRRSNQIKVVTFFSPPAGDAGLEEWMGETIGRVNIIRFSYSLPSLPREISIAYEGSAVLIPFSIWEMRHPLGIFMGRIMAPELPDDPTMERVWRYVQRNYRLGETDLGEVGKFSVFSTDRNPVVRAIYSAI